MKEKRYWLRGLVIGVVFGALITYAHEHMSEFARFFDINPYAYSPEYWSIPKHMFYAKYSHLIQQLYVLTLYPAFILGYLVLKVQYFLPSVSYGILGAIIGWTYGKIINRNHAIS